MTITRGFDDVPVPSRDLSPSWAMSGQAIDGAGDSHLAAGRHLRIVTNPLLGLPVCPVVVDRIVLTLKELLALSRSDLLWVDSEGVVQTPPFTVSEGNPVTGHLPAAACWVQVNATASRPIRRFPLPRPGPVVVTPDLRPVEAKIRQPRLRPVPQPGRDPLLHAAAEPGQRREIRAGIGPVGRREKQQIEKKRRSTGKERLAEKLRVPGLRVEAMVTTPLGDAPVATRSRAPYQVYASHIQRVVVSGSGTVSGLNWLNPERVPSDADPRWKSLPSLPLPCGPGHRYGGPPDGDERGLRRARDAAPTRRGMHEQPAAAAPGACEPVGPDQERTRVDGLADALRDGLDQLVHDLSVPPQELVATDVLSGDDGPLGTSDRPLLLTLLQATLDPGIARWLPFGAIDRADAEPDTFAIYLVRGAWAPHWTGIDRLELRTTLPAAGDPRQIVTSLQRRAKQTWSGKLTVPDAIGLAMILVAPVGIPLDVPVAPTTSLRWDGSWQAVPPPTARRRLAADLDALVAGASVASAIAQPSGSALETRHLEDGTGRRVLLGASTPAAASRPTQGTLTDRGVGADGGTWRIAQSDWFGRWSGWSVSSFGAGERPRPPRPVVLLTSSPPMVPTPAPTSALAGSVRIEVPIPPPSSLPPGGRPLARMELTVGQEGGSPAVSEQAVPSGDSIVTHVRGPELLPTESASLTVTVRWIDDAGATSDPSEPRTATLQDPRPPAPVVLDARLTYTARPDAAGWAQTTLTWSAERGQHSFRVFVADETTLGAKLAEVAAGKLAAGDEEQAPSATQARALLDALKAAAGAPERGAAWETHKAILPRRWFLQLTSTPVPATPTTTFRHQVSGSLTVLSLYRVIAVSAAGAESDFRTSSLLPRAVPNLLAPPVPSLSVTPVTPSTGDLQAVLTVTVPTGPTAAERWRLRRASATTDPALMPVVAEGSMTDATTQNSGQTIEIVDDGSSPHLSRSSLVAWVRYTWRVEVAGGTLPGGGPPGEWSAPSAPVSTTVMPTDPPTPVTGLSTVRETDGVHVRFASAEVLAPGASTGYVVDLYRQRPGGMMRMATSVPGTATGPDGTFDIVDPDPAVPSGTSYRVIVTDPIGRSTAPSEEVLAP